MILIMSQKVLLPKKGFKNDFSIMFKNTSKKEKIHHNMGTISLIKIFYHLTIQLDTH